MLWNVSQVHQCTGVVRVNFSKCTLNGSSTLASASLVLFTFGIQSTVHFVWLHTLFNRSSKAFVKNADPVRRTLWKFYWFIALVICCLKSGVGVFRLSLNNRLTRHSRSGKHSRLGHVIGTREMSHGRSLRSTHFIWFLTTWVTVGNPSKCVFVLILMLGWVKNSH